MENRRIIIIYGTGKCGEFALSFLKKLRGIEDIHYCETFPKCKTKNGILILSLKELIDIKDSIKMVFVAISNPYESSKIENLVKGFVLDEVPVYGLNGLFQYYKERNDMEDDTKDKYCVLCHSNIEKFEAASIVDDLELFKQHHVIGAGFRNDMLCPKCHGDDRTRWILYVLTQFTDICIKPCRVLHIAPEREIEELLRSNTLCDYYSGDIEPGRAMHVVDVTNIQFTDSFFDYIILNHVLEHIEDEAAAINELIRTLKPLGSIIMSFPICTDMRTQEEKSVVSKEQRLKLYGQHDHVRLYGNDYVERLERYGLSLDVYTPFKRIEYYKIKKFGFIEDDILMFCKVRKQ